MNNIKTNDTDKALSTLLDTQLTQFSVVQVETWLMTIFEASPKNEQKVMKSELKECIDKIKYEAYDELKSIVEEYSSNGKY